MEYTILIIGNEIHVAQEIQGILEKQGAIVDVAYNGEHGIANAQNNMHNLIIIDFVLPDMSGIEVLSKLRETVTQTPIIMLYSIKQSKYIAKALEYGASEFIMKPLSLKEILYKARTLLGIETQEEITKPISFGDIDLNLEKRTLSCKEASVPLYQREFQIMALLIYTPEQIFSKQEIIDKFWGNNYNLEYNTIEVHISVLRKKINSIGAKTTIRTVRGAGYALTMRK